MTKQAFFVEKYVAYKLGKDYNYINCSKGKVKSEDMLLIKKLSIAR